MKLQKNESVRLEITDISAEGMGIGKVEGYTLFIKDALPGDEIEAKIIKCKKNYGFARLERLVRPSKFRVEPRCKFARKCGGCQIQELDYQEQLRFKERLIENNLMRIGGFEKIPMDTIIGMDEPFYYRNKAQFPVGTDKDGRVVTGFYAGRTHSIIPNRDCCLGHPVNESVLDVVISFMEANGITAYDETTGEGCVRHVLIRVGFFTGEIMVCLVVNGNEIPKSSGLVDVLKGIEGMTSICLNVNQERTNVIMGDEVIVLWGRGYIEDTIGDVRYQISPLSFYQVNPVQTRRLYDLVKEYAQLTGEETVWDLYCGIGTISLYLAGEAKRVYGVEIVPQAIEDARRNAKINMIENAEFYVGKAEEVLPRKYSEDGVKADVIVVDPPRKGCDVKLLETILQMEPEKVVYVSCDSATLARDLRVLCDGGYEVRKVRGVDNFGNTVHVETVVSLSLKNGTSK